MYGGVLLYLSNIQVHNFSFTSLTFFNVSWLEEYVIYPLTNVNYIGSIVYNVQLFILITLQY